MQLADGVGLLPGQLRLRALSAGLPVVRAGFPRQTRTGDGQGLLNGLMQQTALLGVRRLIVDLLAVPAADYQRAGLQLAEVMGDGGTGHLHHGGDVYDAFLAVA